MRIAYIIALAFLLAAALVYAVDPQVCCLNANAGVYKCQVVNQTQCCPTNSAYYAAGGPANNAACITPTYTPLITPLLPDCSGLLNCTIGCCCPEGKIDFQLDCPNTTSPYQKFYDTVPPPSKSCAEFCGSGQKFTGTSCTAGTLTATPERGEKQINLRWTEPSGTSCPEVYSYQVYRCQTQAKTGAVDCSDLTKFTQVGTAQQGTTTFIDDSDDLKWNLDSKPNSVKYYIKVVGGAATSISSAVVYLQKGPGDIECWKHYNDNDFCFSAAFETLDFVEDYLTSQYTQPFTAKDAFSDQGKALRCDNKNSKSEIKSCESDYACAIIGSNAECLPIGNCRSKGGAFGLFASKDSCEPNSKEDAFCYYDDRTATSAPGCFQCSSAMSCLSYKSQESCEADACNVGTAPGACNWRMTIPEISSGVCVDINQNNCAYCQSQADTASDNSNAYNKFFDGTCTGAMVAALSTPAHACATYTDYTCSTYQSSQECNKGPSPGEKGTLSRDPNTNEVTAHTGDSARINKCIWSSKCVKDADVNNVDDCAGKANAALTACQKDYFPPQSRIVQSSDKSVFTITVLDKTSSSDTLHVVKPAFYTTYVCGYQSTDYAPISLPASTCDLSDPKGEHVLEVTDNSFTVAQLIAKGIIKKGSNDNMIKFFTQDPSKNLEVMTEDNVLHVKLDKYFDAVITVT